MQCSFHFMVIRNQLGGNYTGNSSYTNHAFNMVSGIREIYYTQNQLLIETIYRHFSHTHARALIWLFFGRFMEKIEFMNKNPFENTCKKRKTSPNPRQKFHLQSIAVGQCINGNLESNLFELIVQCNILIPIFYHENKTLCTLYS